MHNSTEKKRQLMQTRCLCGLFDHYSRKTLSFLAKQPFLSAQYYRHNGRLQSVRKGRIQIQVSHMQSTIVTYSLLQDMFRVDSRPRNAQLLLDLF